MIVEEAAVRVTCGAVMACGRNKDHRGHHGGFRPVVPKAPGQQAGKK